MSLKYPEHVSSETELKQVTWHNRNQNWQRHSFDRRPEFYNRQITDQIRFSQSCQNNDNDTHFLTRQAITQTLLNSTQEDDGSDREATILWMDHIALVAKKIGIDPLEVGISELRGRALGDINAICNVV